MGPFRTEKGVEMTRQDDGSGDSRPLESLVFVGFNSQVVALDRHTGEAIWTWKCPDGSGFVALLLDGEQLVASIQGYTHCLDPLTGAVLWSNPLTGMGTGVPCLASVRGGAGGLPYAVLAQAASEAESQSHVNAALIH